jgi:hypothetical protein
LNRSDDSLFGVFVCDSGLGHHDDPFRALTGIGCAERHHAVPANPLHLGDDLFDRLGIEILSPPRRSPMRTIRIYAPTIQEDPP